MKQICLSIPTGDQVAQDAKKVSSHNFLSFTVGGFNLQVILLMVDFALIFHN